MGHRSQLTYGIGSTRTNRARRPFALSLLFLALLGATVPLSNAVAGSRKLICVDGVLVHSKHKARVFLLRDILGACDEDLLCDDACTVRFGFINALGLRDIPQVRPGPEVVVSLAGKGHRRTQVEVEGVPIRILCRRNRKPETCGSCACRCGSRQRLARPKSG
jgi:hypothetical protein